MTTAAAATSCSCTSHLTTSISVLTERCSIRSQPSQHYALCVSPSTLPNHSQHPQTAVSGRCLHPLHTPIQVTVIIQKTHLRAERRQRPVSGGVDGASGHWTWVVAHIRLIVDGLFGYSLQVHILKNYCNSRHQMSHQHSPSVQQRCSSRY